MVALPSAGFFRRPTEDPGIWVGSRTPLATSATLLDSESIQEGIKGRGRSPNEGSRREET